MRHLITALSIVLLLGSVTVQAEPIFARQYKSQYGYQPSCNACHKDGGGSPLNVYGKQYKDAGKNAAALLAIAAKDADGDGTGNGDEAAAKANPGDKASTPKNPGNWLDTASLIPKEVQAAFPGIKAYLPKDATLTAEETARAKTLGAALSSADENTIYIPVGEDKKPVGTALIAPGHHQGKPFFLLLTTDSKLVVTRVMPLNTKQVPDAAKSKLYASFTGKSAKELPAATAGKSVDDAITDAVKRGGTLLYVRLKKD